MRHEQAAGHRSGLHSARWLNEVCSTKALSEHTAQSDTSTSTARTLSSLESFDEQYRARCRSSREATQALDPPTPATAHEAAPSTAAMPAPPQAPSTGPLSRAPPGFRSAGSFRFGIPDTPQAVAPAAHTGSASKEMKTRTLAPSPGLSAAAAAPPVPQPVASTPDNPGHPSCSPTGTHRPGSADTGNPGDGHGNGSRQAPAAAVGAVISAPLHTAPGAPMHARWGPASSLGSSSVRIIASHSHVSSENVGFKLLKLAGATPLA